MSAVESRCFTRTRQSLPTDAICVHSSSPTFPAGKQPSSKNATKVVWKEKDVASITARQLCFNVVVFQIHSHAESSAPLGCHSARAGRFHCAREHEFAGRIRLLQALLHGLLGVFDDVRRLRRQQNQLQVFVHGAEFHQQLDRNLHRKIGSAANPQDESSFQWSCMSLYVAECSIHVVSEFEPMVNKHHKHNPGVTEGNATRKLTFLLTASMKTCSHSQNSHSLHLETKCSSSHPTNKLNCETHFRLAMGHVLRIASRVSKRLGA